MDSPKIIRRSPRLRTNENESSERMSIISLTPETTVHPPTASADESFDSMELKSPGVSPSPGPFNRGDDRSTPKTMEKEMMTQQEQQLIQPCDFVESSGKSAPIVISTQKPSERKGHLEIPDAQLGGGPPSENRLAVPISRISQVVLTEPSPPNHEQQTQRPINKPLETVMGGVLRFWLSGEILRVAMAATPASPVQKRPAKRQIPTKP